MSENFVAITTQEEFDARISERLKRERETISKRYEEKYAGYVSKDDHDQAIATLNDEIATAREAAAQNQATIDGLNAKVHGYETASVKTRIAHEVGLPYELAERLTGDDEAAIRKDAEALTKLIPNWAHVGAAKASAPAAKPEPTQGANGTVAAYQTLLNNMRTEA